MHGACVQTKLRTVLFRMLMLQLGEPSHQKVSRLTPMPIRLVRSMKQSWMSTSSAPFGWAPPASTAELSRRWTRF